MTSDLLILVAGAGFEPATFGLWVANRWSAPIGDRMHLSRSEALCEAVGSIVDALVGRRLFKF